MEEPPPPDSTTTSPLLPRPTPHHPILHHLSSRLRLRTTIWSELGGSVGDLGTYIPIVLALTLVNGLDLSTTLIFTSLYNILTGLLFGVPMPVQPMKSIAAVAIAESDTPLTVPQIMAAGISTAAVLFILGATGLMSVFYRVIPLPVVRGSLSFAFTAIKYIRFDQDFTTGKSGGPRDSLGLDGLILALATLLFVVLVTGSGDDGDANDEIRPPRRRPVPLSSSVPAALLVFLFGLALCFARDPSIISHLKFGPSKPKLVKFTWEDWKIGFVRAAVPQIPLSVLNSVIAVCKLSADLFPDREVVSAASVSVSVGAMNLVGCWFGAMPVCHGAGGLAGQYRFGGRSGLCVVFLGLGKLALALVLGNSLTRVLDRFPVGMLGVLLMFSGVELAMASRDMGTKEDSFVMLVCAAVSLTGSSAALGFGP
ncbi:Molybdate transporter 2 [Acorus calamus]|uniref:Molybdate transporter 2 n=1 Tax=Acorus calamus TaxID=4465 RepID=A0AAV9BZ15_ACOCL|nr:Molybdate transporter 2 [Acorus calamus]